MWGMFLYTIHDEDPAEYEILEKKVKGQIWDSPFVDIERMPRVGSSIMFPRNPVVQKSVENYERLAYSTL